MGLGPVVVHLAGLIGLPHVKLQVLEHVLQGMPWSKCCRACRTKTHTFDRCLADAAQALPACLPE